MVPVFAIVQSLSEVTETATPPASTSKKRTLALVIVAIVVVAIIGGVLLLNRLGSPPVKPTGVTRSFTLVEREFSFNGTSPGPILQANLGDEVKITIINSGSGGHDLTLLTRQLAASPYTWSLGDIWHQSAGGTGALLGGQTTTLTFFVDRAGTFSYLCSVAGHADAGMIGRLVIS